ncbi:hypothetical protein HY634_03135 [Candidatus Uhrbacteria bacterium]|nr:hypothetical protein [Candidatus Uhrbacteria bacterium]
MSEPSMSIAALTPQEHARGFAAQYAGVFATLIAYLEIRTSDAGDEARTEFEALLRQGPPLPTYSEYRRQHHGGAGLPDKQTRERVLLDGAVRGLNARVASGHLLTNDTEAAELYAYTCALAASIRGEGDFPGLLAPAVEVRQ